jgi:hypothetical protein
MTTYTATFRTDAEFATRDFKAATPEQALKKARRFYANDPLDLMFESYDGGMPVNEIVIADADHDELAVWRDDDMRLRLAARDVLEALEDLLGDRPAVQGGICQHCGRDYIGDFLEGDCLSDDCPGEKARAAIAKAKGGAA